MKRNYYISQSGEISRKNNTIFFKNQNTRKVIPVNDIEAIYIFGEVNLNTKLLDFLSQNQIVIHFFNYYGFYSGSYIPREYLSSGYLLVNQVKHYLNLKKRIEIAKEFVLGAAHNTIKNLIYGGLKLLTQQVR